MRNSGSKALKIAQHKPGEIIHNHLVFNPLTPPRKEEIEALRLVLANHIPGAAGDLEQSCTCLYTNSPDQHFIVGKHPEFDRVSLAAGFSGHGFKFATVMGEVLADLASNGSTRHPIEFLNPMRFMG